MVTTGLKSKTAIVITGLILVMLCLTMWGCGPAPETAPTQTPDVHWHDVGGLHAVKNRLK